MRTYIDTDIQPAEAWKLWDFIYGTVGVALDIFDIRCVPAHLDDDAGGVLDFVVQGDHSLQGVNVAGMEQFGSLRQTCTCL